MKKINTIFVISIAFVYLFACTGCDSDSKKDFAPYADGTYTAEEGHSHSHSHEHDDEDEHEHEHEDEDEHEE